jgi:hypothetical protein
MGESKDSTSFRLLDSQREKLSQNTSITYRICNKILERDRRDGIHGFHAVVEIIYAHIDPRTSILFLYVASYLEVHRAEPKWLLFLAAAWNWPYLTNGLSLTESESRSLSHTIFQSFFTDVRKKISASRNCSEWIWETVSEVIQCFSLIHLALYGQASLDKIAHHREMSSHLLAYTLHYCNKFYPRATDKLSAIANSFFELHDMFLGEVLSASSIVPRSEAEVFESINADRN